LSCRGVFQIVMQRSFSDCHSEEFFTTKNLNLQYSYIKKKSRLPRRDLFLQKKSTINLPSLRGALPRLVGGFHDVAIHSHISEPSEYFYTTLPSSKVITLSAYFNKFSSCSTITTVSPKSKNLFNTFNNLVIS